MANLSLAQLRDAQKAQPSFVNADGVREPFIVPILHQKKVNPGRESERDFFWCKDAYECPPAPPGPAQPTFNGSPPAAAAGSPSTEGSLPLQASPASVPAAASGGFQTDTVGACPSVDGTRGYCRIFPATYPTAADIPEDWKKANWGTDPGPWQHLEGQPMHPDFEANLTLLEQAVCD